MSLLERARATRPAGGAPATDRAPAYLAGAVAGVRAAGISLALIAVPLLAIWATAAHVTASWTQALRLSASAWLLLQHVAIAYPGGHLGLVPWGLTAVPALVLYRTGRRLAADPVVAPAPATGRSGAAPDPGPGLRPALEGIVGLALGYAAVATLLALIARSAQVRPVLWQAPIGPAVLAAVAGTAGLARAHPRGADLGEALRSTGAGRLLTPVPPLVRMAARGARRAVIVLLVAAVVLVVGTVLWHGERVLTLHRALGPGVAGGALLVVGQIGYLPDLAGWALSWLSGAGFAVGAGTTFAPRQVHAGVLPVIPVLGALPDRALPTSWAALAVLAVPVLAGVVAAVAITRRAVGGESPLPSLVDDLLTALVAAALTAAVLTVVLALSAGPIGPGRLAVVGPTAWAAGLALLLELALGAVLGVLAVDGARGWRRHRAAARASGQSARDTDGTDGADDTDGTDGADGVPSAAEDAAL